MIFAWWVSSQDSTTELPTESTKSVKCDRQVWFLLNKQENCVQYCMCCKAWLLTEYNYITVISLYGRKGTKLNKCLCKAPVCGVIMVTVLLISEWTKMSAVVQGLYDEIRIVLSELQGYCNGVVMEFCSSVCLFDQICKPNAEHCWYGKPHTGASVTVCNKQQQHVTNDFILCFLVSFAKCLTTFIPCSDNTSFKSAWQNWNKLEEKKCKCAAVH